MMIQRKYFYESLVNERLCAEHKKILAMIPVGLIIYRNKKETSKKDKVSPNSEGDCLHTNNAFQSMFGSII